MKKRSNSSSCYNDMLLLSNNNNNNNCNNNCNSRNRFFSWYQRRSHAASLLLVVLFVMMMMLPYSAVNAGDPHLANTRTTITNRSHHPQNPQQQQQQEEDDNEIVVSNWKITPNAKMTDAESFQTEDLEEVIRNSVKTEIELEQNKVLEVLKEIPEPEVRQKLTDEILKIEYQQPKAPKDERNDLKATNKSAEGSREPFKKSADVVVLLKSNGKTGNEIAPTETTFIPRNLETAVETQSASVDLSDDEINLQNISTESSSMRPMELEELNLATADVMQTNVLVENTKSKSNKILDLSYEDNTLEIAELQSNAPTSAQTPVSSVEFSTSTENNAATNSLLLDTRKTWKENSKSHITNEKVLAETSTPQNSIILKGSLLVLDENIAITESQKLRDELEELPQRISETLDYDDSTTARLETEHVVFKKQGANLNAIERVAEEVPVTTTNAAPVEQEQEEEHTEFILETTTVEQVNNEPDVKAEEDNNNSNTEVPKLAAQTTTEDEIDAMTTIAPAETLDYTEIVVELSTDVPVIPIHVAPVAPVNAPTDGIAKNLNDAAATLFESFLPHNAGQTFNDNLAAESSAGIGKALPTRSINDNSTSRNRSTMIIVLCSGTALIFAVISLVIFLVSFQRQHGTLDIEMQEQRCGKDDLRDEDDIETCTKLLHTELSAPTTITAADETDECL